MATSNFGELHLMCVLGERICKVSRLPECGALSFGKRVWTSGNQRSRASSHLGTPRIKPSPHKAFSVWPLPTSPAPTPACSTQSLRSDTLAFLLFLRMPSPVLSQGLCHGHSCHLEVFTLVLPAMLLRLPYLTTSPSSFFASFFS